MIIVASASADTYITNKIIDATRMVSGNVGRAGTLDLFKLYDENQVVTGALELSRLLIKFDVSKAITLSSSSLSISDPTFKAKLKLRNISAGQPVPSDFTVNVFPLAVAFDEGLGRDVISFADVDASNFLSNSVGSLWNISGAFKSGSLGDSNIDYYVSGNLQDGNGVVSLASSQYFQLGTEDLSVDVTKIVSATIAGILPNNGFRISFTENEETDDITRFVKRFASRHVREQSLRPTLVISSDDSIIDHHSSSYFDLSGTLALHNIARGEYRNFVSGASLTEITGTNCLLVKISTGSFTKWLTGSQVSQGGNITGIYTAPFAIASTDTSVITGSTTIASTVLASGSITFDESWQSLDKTVTFFSGKLAVSSLQGTTIAVNNRKLRTSMPSLPPTIKRGNSITIRVLIYDDWEQNKSAKFSFSPSPLKITDCKYRVRDTSSGKLMFDFDLPGSKMSIDTLSPYANFYTDGMPVGVPLSFEFRCKIDGQETDISSANFNITVSE